MSEIKYRSLKRYVYVYKPQKACMDISKICETNVMHIITFGASNNVIIDNVYL